MIALMQRILRLAEGYGTRIRLAAVCSLLKAFLGKAPLVIAFYMISGFIAHTVTGRSCILAGVAMLLCLGLQCLFQNAGGSGPRRSAPPAP